MIFIFVSIIIPILTLTVLPMLLPGISAGGRDRRWLLVLASLLFFVSWYLPSPLIDGHDTAFTTHFVGGGLYTGCVWLYLRTYFNWPRRLRADIAGLFLLVSALGVLNELFELGLYVTQTTRLTLEDTSWDLWANTLGALVFYAGVRLGQLLQTRS